MLGFKRKLPMLSPYERYCSDTNFRGLVDLLFHELVKCNFTPTEVREAVLLAQIQCEEHRPRFVPTPPLTDYEKEQWLKGEY